MAVAVKNQESTSTGALDRLPVQIVMGVVYVLGSLGILFPLLDAVWWRWLGFDRDNASLWAVLFTVGALTAVGLVALGNKLLGEHPTTGLKAGIAAGTLWVLVVALLSLWFGRSLEELLYARQWFPGAERNIGLGVTGGIAAALLIAGFYLLAKPRTEKGLVDIEEQGWFSLDAYKRSQGVRVRRGTIVGLLVLLGCGIWSLHWSLNRDSGDWTVGLPFTGMVPVTEKTAGDNDEIKTALVEKQKELDEETVRNWLRAEARAIEKAIADKPKLAEQQEKLSALLDGIAQETDLEQLKKNAQELRKSVQTAGVEVAAVPEPAPPEAVVYFDRFALRDKNRAFEAGSVKIVKEGYPGPEDRRKNARKFEPGQIVSKEEFEAENEARKALAKSMQEEGVQGSLPPVEATADAVQPAGKTGETELPPDYRRLTLLPHVQYTVPILLFLLAIWFSYRLVNVPTFADFLIATEAEMNKVSWSTRRQLYQDTIVVLVTVLLMTAYLFVADVAWSQLLKGIGVLRSGQTYGQQQKGNDQDLPW